MLLGTIALPLFRSSTWEWDGTTWLARSAALAPGARASHGMAADVARRRVLLFGGLGPGALGDTWEWDGSAWTQPTLAANPPAFATCAMAFDLLRRRMLLYAGARSTWLYGDLVVPAAAPLGAACAGSYGPPALATAAPCATTQPVSAMRAHFVHVVVDVDRGPPRRSAIRRTRNASDMDVGEEHCTVRGRGDRADSECGPRSRPSTSIWPAYHFSRRRRSRTRGAARAPRPRRSAATVHRRSRHRSPRDEDEQAHDRLPREASMGPLRMR